MDFVTRLREGREGSVLTYPEIEVPDPHHPLTYHRGHPDFIEKATKIDCFPAEPFAHFVAKLKATPDGDRTLLDHSAILYGGALSDGNAHSNVNLSLLVAGQPGGYRVAGHHVRLAQPTPATTLFVTMPDGAGVKVDMFGDCTGEWICAGRVCAGGAVRRRMNRWLRSAARSGGSSL